MTTLRLCLFAPHQSLLCSPTYIVLPSLPFPIYSLHLFIPPLTLSRLFVQHSIMAPSATHSNAAPDGTRPGDVHRSYLDDRSARAEGSLRTCPTWLFAELTCSFQTAYTPLVMACLCLTPTRHSVSARMVLSCFRTST